MLTHRFVHGGLRRLGLLLTLIVTTPALADNLADHPYWRALLHYPAGAAQSEIHEGSFFLAANGARNPSAELNATRDALQQPLADGDDANQHPQCRFPARYRWLQQQQALPQNLSEIPCEDYRYWQGGQPQSRVSMIFATGFLSSPASYYGHLLMKFSPPAGSQAGDLLAGSLNYGALIPDGENPVVYIVKGIFGGYEARYTNSQFYHHNHAYAETELRDLWEYRLNLNASETQALMDHAWELISNRALFDYYFFSDNCAYRMADLLAQIIGQEVLPHRPWSIPYSVFDRLSTLEHHGQPLVQEIVRIPSRQNRFYDKYQQLDAREQQALRQWVDQATRQPALESTLSVSARQRILDSLIDYYEYQRSRQELPEGFQEEKRQLLLQRLQLPAGTPEWNIPAQRPPHEGQRPTLLRLSQGHNSSLGSLTELRLRPAHFDLLNRDVGRPKNTELAMFDLTLARLDTQWQIRQLDLLRLQTLPISPSGLPGDRQSAWQLRLGWQTPDLACQRCASASVVGSWGQAWPLIGGTAFTLLDGQWLDNRHDSGSWRAGPRVGWLGEPLSGWKLRIEFAQPYPLDQSGELDERIEVEQRWVEARDWDLRLLYRKQRSEELSIGISVYF